MVTARLQKLLMFIYLFEFQCYVTASENISRRFEDNMHTVRRIWTKCQVNDPSFKKLIKYNGQKRIKQVDKLMNDLCASYKIITICERAVYPIKTR